MPGVEEWRDGAYRRTLRLPHGHGIVALRPGPDHVSCQLALTDLRDLASAISRCRRLLDLDADPVAVRRPAVALTRCWRRWSRKAPGRRVPRTVDPHEFALRAVLGQQVSTAAARTHAGRLAAALGEPVDDPGGGLSRLFPTAAVLAAADAGRARHAAVQARVLRRARRRAREPAQIDLSVGGDWHEARLRLAGRAGARPVDDRDDRDASPRRPRRVPRLRPGRARGRQASRGCPPPRPR